MMKRVGDKQIEKFNQKASHPLQTWEWGEFRKSTGNEVVRFANFTNNKLVTSYQLIIHKIPRSPYKIGSLIRCPKPTNELFKFLKKLGHDNKLIFTKLEPNYIPSNSSDVSGQIRLLKKAGCVSGKTLFTPSTFWIDLKLNEEDLLKGFSSKTRYNIRLAQRKGVKVGQDNSKDAFEAYIKLTRETVERQEFFAHSEKYHRLMWKFLHQDMVKKGQSPIARILTAKYNSEIITTWIVFVWGNFLYYPYGASSEKFKNKMPNNLMMWEAIRYGKKLGLSTFDLWGREPEKGFTRFKEGYNPKVIKFIGTWDMVSHPLYRTYRALETLRWRFLRAKSKFSKPKF